MIVYKLTDQDWCTRGPTKWGPGVTHTAPGTGDLCGHGWLHAYTSPRLAMLMNPAHANIPDPILWEGETPQIGIDDCGIKIGVRHLTTMLIVPAPVYTTVQRVAFGILCAREVYSDAGFREWAATWLSGMDRSYKSAAAARADAAAYAAAVRAAAVRATAYVDASRAAAVRAAIADAYAATTVTATFADGDATAAATAAATFAAEAGFGRAATASRAAVAAAYGATAAGKPLDLDALAICALEIT